MSIIIQQESDNTTMLTSVSFFCPAYRDEGNLPTLIKQVADFLPRIAAVYEIIIVHDGSPDRTGAVADELACTYPFVRVIHHAINEGYGAALRNGFMSARYDYVMYTDGDCQYDVREFSPYLHLLEASDVITGYVEKKAVSSLRMFQSAFYNMIVRFMFNVRIRDINCSMKIYKRIALNMPAVQSTSAFIDAEMLIRAKRAGHIILQFPVTHYKRVSGVASGSRPSVILSTMRDMVLFRLGLL
jgi:glycosyltransferase involved in cell wall biosynthesis